MTRNRNLLHLCLMVIAGMVLWGLPVGDTFAGDKLRAAKNYCYRYKGTGISCRVSKKNRRCMTGWREVKRFGRYRVCIDQADWNAREAEQICRQYRRIGRPHRCRVARDNRRCVRGEERVRVFGRGATRASACLETHEKTAKREAELECRFSLARGTGCDVVPKNRPCPPGTRPVNRVLREHGREYYKLCEARSQADLRRTANAVCLRYHRLGFRCSIVPETRRCPHGTRLTERIKGYKNSRWPRTNVSGFNVCTLSPNQLQRYRRRADAWCANWLRRNRLGRCVVVTNGRGCPSGTRLGTRIGPEMAGIRTCVRSPRSVGGHNIDMNWCRMNPRRCVPLRSRGSSGRACDPGFTKIRLPDGSSRCVRLLR